MGDNNNKKPIVSDLEKNSKKTISKSNDNKKSLNKNINLVKNNNIKDIKKETSSKKIDTVVKNNTNNKRPTNLANTDLNKVLKSEAKVDLQKNEKQQPKKEIKKDNIPVNKDDKQKSPQNQKPQNNNNVIVNNNNNNTATVGTGPVPATDKKPRKRHKWKPGDPGYDSAKDTKLQKKLARAEQRSQEKAKSWPDGRNPNYKGKNYDPDYHKKKKENIIKNIFKNDNKQFQNNFKKQNYKKQPYDFYKQNYRNENYKPFYIDHWVPNLLEFDAYDFADAQKNPTLVEKICYKNWKVLRQQALRYNLLTNRAYFYKKNKLASELFPRNRDERWGWKQEIKNKPIQREESNSSEVTNTRDYWREPTYFRLKLKGTSKKVKTIKNLLNNKAFSVKATNSRNFLTFLKLLTSPKKGFFASNNKYIRLGNSFSGLLVTNQKLNNVTQQFDLQDLSKKDSLFNAKSLVRKSKLKEVKKVKKYSKYLVQFLKKLRKSKNLVKKGGEIKKVLKFLAKEKTVIVRKKRSIADFYFPKLFEKELYQDILSPNELRKLIRMENIKTKNLNFFARIVNHRAAFKEKGEKRPWYDKRWWKYNKRIYDLNIDVSHIFMLKYRNFIFRKVPNLWADTVALLALIRKGQIDGGAYHEAMLTHYRRLYKKHHYGFEQMQRGLSRFLFGRRISVQIWQDPSPIYHEMLREHEYKPEENYITAKNEQETKQLEVLAKKKIRFVKLSNVQDDINKKYRIENKLTHRSLLRGYGVEVAGRIGARPRGKYFFQFGGNVGRQTTHTRAYGFEDAADSLKYGSYGIKLFMRPKELTFRTRKLHAKMSRIIALRNEFINRNVKKLYRFTFIKENKAINQSAVKDSVKYREILVQNSFSDALLKDKTHLVGKKISSRLKRVALLKKNYNKYLNRLEKIKIAKEAERRELLKQGKPVTRKSRLNVIYVPVKKRSKLVRNMSYSLILKQFLKKSKKELKNPKTKSNKKSNNKVNKHVKRTKK